MVAIRYETSEDYAAVYEVNRRAFGRENEALLVDALRREGGAISLVAEAQGRVIGHILFSPIRIETQDGSAAAMSLAPMAVLPEFQNQGAGSALVRGGLEECQRQGHEILIVLGHPNFYPRFGFSPARPQGIEPPFHAPDEAWMVLALQPSALEGVHGMVKYLPAFDEV
jgi:putative acetyltransferase